MTRSLRIGWFLLFVSIATSLPASAALAQRAVRSAGLAEFDSATSAALLREVERASGRGLPTEPLLAKAREGRLKRAPGARIRVAVAALAVRLDSARGALGAESAAEELVAGAEALSAGAEPDALRTLRRESAPRPVSVPLGALAQLVASGVSPGRAVTMIVDLLRRRVTPAQVVAFGNAVEFDVAGGHVAEESAILRLRAVTSPGHATAADAANFQAGASVAPPPPPSTSPRRRP